MDSVSLREQIVQAISSLPIEIRAVAENDLGWLEDHVGAYNLSCRGLEKLLSDATEPPRARAIGAWIVGLIHEKSLVPILENTLQSGPPEEVLWEIVKSLCVLGHGGDLFRELLTRGSDVGIRRAAAYALGCLRERSAEEELCRVLKSVTEDSAVKGQAAEALGYLALESSLPCLLRAAYDPAPEVRFWVAFALGQIRSREAEAVLAHMAKTDHASVEGWGEVAKEATLALQNLRPER